MIGFLSSAVFLRASKLMLVGSVISLSACSLVSPVQPWEKGMLAKPEMTFDSDALDTTFVEHTYSSKEGASGGAGVGGGGCGCN